MIKKCFVSLLCGCLLFSLVSVPSYAYQPATSFSTIKDTTSYTQEQYLNPDQLGKNILSSMSDAETVRLTCESFLAMAKASVRIPARYDLTKKILTTSLGKDTIQYRLSEYAYQAELNKALGHIISDDLLEFTDFSVEFSGDKAIANIVESYTYYINDGFDDESFRRKMYTLELQNIDNHWQIIGITTDDPWELEPNFNYQPINVQVAVSSILSVESLSEADLISFKDENLNDKNRANLYEWTYDTSKAVTYAVAHYRDTSNSVFGFTSGNNCQNFSSQCVWAGLGGSGTSTTARPAVPTSRVSIDAFNVWCRNQNTTYYDKFYFNWAWDNVRGFMKLLRASSMYAEGPYGNAFYADAVKCAEVGNVLSVNWSGTADEDSMDHAMFVTGVTGTFGSRTKGDVKIAAHTTQTNTAYQTLSSYTSAADANFGRTVIWRAHYTVQQP